MNIEIIREMGKAVMNGDLDLVKELLATNEELLNEDCWLHDAATYGQYNIAKHLIECGIDINRKGPFDDEGAIVCAAFKGNLDIVELLYDNGAEIDISNSKCNPLFSAIYSGHLEVVKYLVEKGVDLSVSYTIGQYENMDAYEYAKLYGRTQIADYLKDKTGSVGDTEKKLKERDVLGRVIALYQSETLESNLNKQYFIELFKEAVKDIFPKIKEKYTNESIYGISFEVANTVQRVYDEDYGILVYLNTEENYQEKIENCDEDEKSYYRFNAWAEWKMEEVSSNIFDKIQDYLWENSLGFFDEISTDMEAKLEKEIREWYEDVELDVEDLHDEEIENIRSWLAEALGQLRKEGFWEQQGNANIYVIPFSGEDKISKEELIMTYKEMDQGYHNTEYLDYLEENF